MQGYLGDREKHFGFEATACEVASVSLLLRCSLTILERSSGKVQASSPISVLEVAGEAVLEVFALGSAPVRAGFARSGARTSVLPRVQLTERSGAGPGGGGRAGPGPVPSVALAAATFPRCARIFVMTLRSVMTATIRIVAPHAQTSGSTS